MDRNQPSRVRPGFVLSWLLLLASVYMLTYSALPQSTDTLRIFDAASSFARYGDIARDETIWIEPPQFFDDGLPYPIIQYEQNEPLIVFAGAALYQLADVMPGLGYAHGVWLLNIGVALGCVLFFYAYARVLHYEAHIAALGAVVLGIGTGLWVYTTTLFREPLVMLWLLLCALAIEQFRRRQQVRGWGWLLLAMVAFALAYFTKNSALFALPGLLILTLPGALLPDARRLRRVWDLVLVALLALFVVSIFNGDVYRFLVNLTRPVLDALDARPQIGRTALHTYLFSIGGSLWGTSPILLLGLPGSWLLLRGGQRRLLWAVLAIVVGYAVGHALLAGVHWFGGLSWPPRFLIPVLPFAMALALPTLRWVWQGKRRWLAQAAVLLLALYSVVIQAIGAVSFFGTYVDYLPPEANGLYEWLPGLNTVEYLRWLILPRTWESLGFDIAWTRIGSPLPVIYLLLIALALVLVWARNRRWMRWGVLLGWGVLAVITALGLRSLHENDPLYWAHKSALFDVLAIVEAEAEDGEPLLLADNTYSRFIMNYHDLDRVRPLVLGFPPGEAPSDIAPPRLESDYPPELLENYAPRAIDFLAGHHERIWLLAPNSEFLPWAVRPVERYLGENYFLLREYRTDDPTVRLLLYSTVRAPNRYEFRLPEQTSDLRYGEAIDLLGYTLPEGARYAPGDILPVTFFWQALEPTTRDAVVAWFLAPADDRTLPIQGFDSAPDAGFRRTFTWTPSEVIYDNRALQLPKDLPAGEYRIWVLLYEAGSGGVQRLSVSGGEIRDDDIGVLPVPIHIEAR